MTDHYIGNQYENLGHLLELVEKHEGGFGVVRHVLSCTTHGGCCTTPNGLKIECVVDYLDLMQCTKEVDPRYYPQCLPQESWQKGDIAEVVPGWENAGNEFRVLGPAVYLGQWWVPIEDPEDDDPGFQKEASLVKVKNGKSKK